MSGMGSPAPSATRSSSATTTSNFNDADVTFASDMIAHHRHAAEMAKFADSRAKSPEVKDPAVLIMSAQDPEIAMMTSWLTQWGQPVPEDMGGMDVSDSMPGMMSSDEMDQLKNASGVDFDQMFLTMIIEHHEGVIEMAETELVDGTNPDAISLASQIEQA